MRKIIISFTLWVLLFLPISVYAKGNISIDSSSLTIRLGDTKTVTISAYNAVGDVSISSNDTSIVSVDKDYWDTGIIDDDKTVEGVISLKGEKVGATTITLKIDGATFDEEDLSGQTKTINVNVVNDIDEELQPSNVDKKKITIEYKDLDGNKIKDDTFDYVEDGNSYRLNCPDNLVYNNSNYVLDAISNSLKGKITSDVSTICKYTKDSKKTGDSFIVLIGILGLCMFIFTIYQVKKRF